MWPFIDFNFTLTWDTRCDLLFFFFFKNVIFQTVKYDILMIFNFVFIYFTVKVLSVDNFER